MRTWWSAQWMSRIPFSHCNKSSHNTSKLRTHSSKPNHIISYHIREKLQGFRRKAEEYVGNSREEGMIKKTILGNQENKGAGRKDGQKRIQAADGSRTNQETGLEKKRQTVQNIRNKSDLKLNTPKQFILGSNTVNPASTHLDLGTNSFLPFSCLPHFQVGEGEQRGEL